jgi:nucleotide-binding universal stress UspA family protein
MAGSVASVVLAPVTVPVLTYLMARRQMASAAAASTTASTSEESPSMWAYPPRQILVAVDFGPASARALRVAQAIAARHGSAITALHAETIEVPPYFTHDQLQDVERHHAESRREAEAYLAAFVREHAPQAVSALVEGPAVSAVLALAARHDLLVIGTHGRRGAGRWFMGSAAERIVRDTPIPTLVVRAGLDGADEAEIFAHPLAVAGPESAGEARRYASGLAAAFGGTLGDKPVASIDDLTCAPEATLMAVAVGTGHGGGWFGHTAEHLVRNCKLPMLFVPNRA